ncbi:MAG TPA: WxcM-like domain-containing protein [Treponema sp.]|nr:WxcM-like domain-containing protein [Treponema sp.]
MNYKIINFDVHGDSRGKLVALQNLKEIPFEIKRIYYIYDTLPGESRGFHAHKELEQIIIAMDGACTVVLDDGTRRQKVVLNRPDMGLYIGKCMWREMHDFSYGCKLVVLASGYYDEKEYIRNYEEFLKELEY